MSTTSKPVPVDGVVVGVSEGQLSATASSDFKQYSSIDLAQEWSTARVRDHSKAGQLRVFYPRSAKESVVAAISVAGKPKPVPTTSSDALPSAQTWLRNDQLEETRRAAAKGVRALREVDAQGDGSADAGKNERRTFAIDTFSSPHAAAVGADLALFQVDQFRTRGPRSAMKDEYDLQAGRNIEVVTLAPNADPSSLKDTGDEVKSSKVPLSWQTGKVYAEAQNWARELQETPANLMTPTIFSKVVVEKLKGLKNVSAEVHDEEWARSKGMGSFLSVTQGTDQPAKMLELHYKGAGPNAPTLGLVGKGITFDSGGISLKPALNMKLMRADMGGAATVVSTLYALAKLQIPVNVVCVTALTENMPSGKATKPGDLAIAMNGLTIDVDNTDAEGRLVLADALTYVSREFKPAVLIDVATLTGAMVIAAGDVFSGAFVEDESLWQGLKAAGEAENDPFWRMPLDDRYLSSIAESYADLINVGRPHGASAAAIFLKQFVEGLEDRVKGTPATLKYAHLDIAGSMEATTTASPYQNKGNLTGRPVRALVEYARRFAAGEQKS